MYVEYIKVYMIRAVCKVFRLHLKKYNNLLLYLMNPMMNVYISDMVNNEVAKWG